MVDFAPRKGDPKATLDLEFDIRLVKGDVDGAEVDGTESATSA